jgi:26S proteasome regulatory subunit N6
VFAIIAGKSASKISGIDIESMKAIAEAYKKRSLYEFKQVLEKYKEQLVDDPTINSQLNSLYENLVQQNLLKIIEPYSRVQLEFIAKQIDLPLVLIQQKYGHNDLKLILIRLSEMILDKKFHGILDQGAGDLIIYDEMPSDVG